MIRTVTPTVTPQKTDMSILVATMRVAQVSSPGGPLELVERPIPDPGPGSVRIKVQACGVCHSDAMTKEGHRPGIAFPRGKNQCQFIFQCRLDSEK